MKKTPIKIEYRKTKTLVPYARNARKHDAAQVSALAGSIREFGFTNPVLIDEDGTIIAGHGRVLGATQAGVEDVPCVVLSHLTDAQKQAYRIADNRLAEIGGGWDMELLNIDVTELEALDFSKESLGFTAEAWDELNGLLESPSLPDNSGGDDATYEGICKAAEPVLAAFPHAGGKRWALKHIIPHIPAHRVYCEPFAGGAAVFFAKKRAEVECINDKDGGLVTFYRIAQENPDALFAECAKWPGNSREAFHLLRERINNPETKDSTLAAYWLLVRCSSWGGKMNTWGRDKDSFRGYDPAFREPLIRAVGDRLQRVYVENKDWIEVASFFDAEDGFMFFDPPYVDVADVGYKPFSASDMEAVRNFLSTAKCSWMLTCNDVPETRQIFKGLPHKELSVKYGMAALTATNAGEDIPETTELLIFSPKIAPSDAEIL